MQSNRLYQLLDLVSRRIADLCDTADLNLAEAPTTSETYEEFFDAFELAVGDWKAREQTLQTWIVDIGAAAEYNIDSNPVRMEGVVGLNQHLQTVCQERDDSKKCIDGALTLNLKLEKANANLSAAESRVRAELRKLVDEKDAACTSRDEVIAERDNLFTERDNLVTERDNLVTERNNLVTERDNLVTERDGLTTERENRVTEYDGLATDYNDIATEHNGLATECDGLITERDGSCYRA